LVYLGWLIPEKGIWDLLAVLPELSRKLPSLRVWMYGPYGADAVRDASVKLGIQHVVHVGEWVEGAEKTELLGRARALALPSYSEGLPVVLLEAMASGTPCVATHVGGIPEVVKDGHTGYLIDPADRTALVDRIERLFADDAAWQRFSDAAVMSARRYDATAVSAQVVDEYERLTAGGSA
jgi:glycosyltransferase involved in cell wall biosynthesis